MPEFVYSAYHGIERRSRGTIHADSRESAIADLIARGLEPVSVEIARSRSLSFGIGKGRRLSSADRAVLARQLADLLAAGMPLLDALTVLERQAESPALRRVVSALGTAVHQGKGLAGAMESCPRDFHQVQIGLVRAGEGAALLVRVLEQLAALEEREIELRSKVTATLVYPAITAGVGLITVLTILRFVVPRLATLFEDMNQTLPVATRILLLASDSASWLWRYGLLAVGGALILGRVLLRSEHGRGRRDRFLLRVPSLGALIEGLHVARFTGILASLLRSGVPMASALSITSETMENRTVRGRLREATAGVKRGMALGEALEVQRAVPRVASGMISVGERTGNLEATLDRISWSYAAAAEKRLRTLVSLIEPVVILVLGGIVAFIVAAVILPIFQINVAP